VDSAGVAVAEIANASPGASQAVSRRNGHPRRQPAAEQYQTNRSGSKMQLNPASEPGFKAQLNRTRRRRRFVVFKGREQPKLFCKLNGTAPSLGSE
jgi:hypothetical protein